MAVAAVVATMKEAHWLRCWWMSESPPSLFSVVAFRKLTGVNQRRWSWETENQKDRWLDSIFQALFFFFFLLQCTRIAPFDHDDEITNEWEKGAHSFLSSSSFLASKSSKLHWFVLLWCLLIQRLNRLYEEKNEDENAFINFSRSRPTYCWVRSYKKKTTFNELNKSAKSAAADSFPSS